MNHNGYSLPPSIRGRRPVPWTPPLSTTWSASARMAAAPPAPRRAGDPNEAPPETKASRANRPVRVELESVLPCSADAAWQAVQTSRLLTDICFPLVMFGRVDGHEFPEQWPAGESLDCRSYLFGMIPLGRRRIRFERIDGEAREIQSRESDLLVARWDHLIQITPAGPNQCRYRDEILIEAGRLTGLVAWFARRLYHHRQKRWQAVARKLKAQEICRLARAAA
jgi:hypothetical protein